MFLIGVDHDQIGDRIAREIANHAIALIDGETRGATITGHRHPTGIDDDPTLVMLMADHSCEHREVQRMEADRAAQPVRSAK
jgi:hypothetical protein